MPPPFESAPTTDDDQEARVLRLHLERALACLVRGDLAGARHAARLAADGGVERVLVVETDGRSYTCGDAVVSLQRRGNLRRILWALVTQARTRPGVALSRDDVLEAGWPGERMRADSGALRVYTAVRRLRQGGLGSVLLTRDDGYLIDPQVRLRLR